MTHHQHAAAFLALIDEARPRVREISIAEYGERLMRGERHVLIDVREDHEWAAGRLPGALHLGRGIIERDIESYFADRSTPIVRS
jgi:rhodanese-related sulfurtransferase